MTATTEEALDRVRRRFKVTENPLEAWGAFLLARQFKVPTPEWVLDYFEGVAQRILKLQAFTPGECLDEKELEKKRKKMVAALSAALGFTTVGRGASPWRWLEDRERDREIGIAVAKRLKEGAKLYIARQEVAEEFGVAEKTVRDAYERFTELLNIC